MRARVIEWLMVNHPHDCAVCEEGGACHLQDMTVATGHRTRRYRFEKRTHRNQDLGPLLTHEMNRCIACYRCTRFYRHYAGGRDLDVFGAHDNVYFGRAEDGVLESPFAGNLAEVCPTGVFNDKGWSQDYARKWDMSATPSVCAQCSVGLQHLRGRAGRPRPPGPEPLQRRDQRSFPVRQGPVRRAARRRARPISERPGRRRGRSTIGGRYGGRPRRLGQGAVAIGSPRASLETNFASAHACRRGELFRGRRRCRGADRRAHGALLAEGPARIAELRDIETADAAIVLGEDLTGTAPRAALTLRQTSRAAQPRAGRRKRRARLARQRRAGRGRGPARADRHGHTAARRAGRYRDNGRSVARRPKSPPSDGPSRRRSGATRSRTPRLRRSPTRCSTAEAPAIIAGSGTGRADIVEAAAEIARAPGREGAPRLLPARGQQHGPGPDRRRRARGLRRERSKAARHEP